MRFGDRRLHGHCCGSLRVKHGLLSLTFALCVRYKGWASARVQAGKRALGCARAAAPAHHRAPCKHALRVASAPRAWQWQ